MQLISDGKTKTLYADGDDKVKIIFKDDVTGNESGIDPGGNTVVGQIDGKGIAVLKQSVYFFELLERKGVPTHYVASDMEENVLIARKATWLGLEFIVRFKAFGSFTRRYGKFVKEGANLGTLVEITVKDDEREDPLINEDALVAVGLMRPEQIEEAKLLVKNAAEIIRANLHGYGMQLLDLKFECGIVDDRLVIIDDISTDNMRIVKDGEKVDPDELLRVVNLAK